MKRAEIRIRLSVPDDWTDASSIAALEALFGLSLDGMYIETTPMQLPAAKVEISKDGKMVLQPQFLDPYSLPEKGVHLSLDPHEPPAYPSASLEWHQSTVEDA
jgi:hypothetical protein